MSSRRIVLSGAVIAGLLLAGSWYTSEAFPLIASPDAAPPWPMNPTVADVALQRSGGAAPQVNAVTPENPIPRRLFSTPVPYPAELAGTGARGYVELEVVLNNRGSVASTTRVGGSSDEAFFASAVAAIRQWQYDPPVNAPLRFYVVVTFGQPGRDATTLQSDARRAVAGVRIPDAIVPPPPPPPPLPGQPVRVGGQVKAPVQTRKVDPDYPPIAIAARVQGVVILELRIDEQGRVYDARILRSIPLLDQAALDAVRQWEYEPTLLNGVPVQVIMTATVQFSASDWPTPPVPR